MCGFTGFIGTIYSPSELRKIIAKSCRLLHHRGPDQEGNFISPYAAFGTTRLAIQDPLNGTQPMTYKEYKLLFNGELYNAELLKERLKSKGYLFTTTSDTEVLLYALCEYGDSILIELEGMFALAFWDSKQRSLLLARDRWGEKPLFYSLQENNLTFSSEIKAIFCFPHIQNCIDEEDLIWFQKNSYLSNEKTGWKNIHKIGPGSYLKFVDSQLLYGQYFNPSIDTKSIPFSSEYLFHLLEKNTRRCIESDKKVGSFLSGGLDSSTIAYFLQKEIPHPAVFSLHWNDKDYTEETYTQEVAKALHLSHHTVTCDARFFIDNFDFIVDLYDEPFGDESMIPTYCLAKLAKSYVDVVLTGDGADEFFHGYERYFYEGEFADYLDLFSATPEPVMNLICKPDHLQEKNLLPKLVGHIPTDRKRSWLDIKDYLPGDILTKVDRSTMAVGLEARAPFLTPDITNFALNCPMDLLVNTKGQGKAILRQTMEKYLPRRVIERKKMGFGVPLNKWFRGELREWITARLKDGDLFSLDWVSKTGVNQLLDLHISNKGNYARPLLNLLVLERWIKRWKLNHSLREHFLL